MKNLYIILTLTIILGNVIKLKAQEEKKAERIFQAYSLIFNQSVRQPPKKGFNLDIQHRFGKVDFEEQKYWKNFLGMDLSSNIRFGFQFLIYDWLSLGVGRTKNNKQYDFETKISILSQTKDNSKPLSVSFYTDFIIMSDDFPEIVDPENTFFEDGKTPFEYTFNHRLSYVNQILVARKFTNWLSLQFSPAVIYRNLVDIGDENLKYVFPIGGYIKTGLMTGIIFEYGYVFDKMDGCQNIWGVAFEIRSTGHAFQISLTNSQRLTLNQLYTGSTVDITKGNFFLGFNIHRNFYFK